MSEFNYIIAGGEGFYKIAYGDLNRLENVRYFQNYVDGINSPITRISAKINFNLKINRFIKTPLKYLVFRRIYPAKFPIEKPLCFIFFGAQFAVINTGFMEYLKSKYRTPRFVLYMQDIVGSLPYYDIENYKERFDLVLSYDKNDCDKYNLRYYPTPFSYINPELFVRREPIDVYFCGFAKNRYPEIFKVYDICKKQDLKCKFFISGVPVADRIESDEIIYDRRISYLDNLSYVNASKCVLEIMQRNAVGFTPRVWEALFYSKHLLTDNPHISECDCYDINQFHSIDEADNIKSWIYSEIDYKRDLIDAKSPVHLIDHIESILKELR